MTAPTWLLKLLAAAAIPAAIGVGAALSAPTPGSGQAETVVEDADFQPGMDGIDYASVTGPEGSKTGRVPACADPERNAGLRPCL